MSSEPNTITKEEFNIVSPEIDYLFLATNNAEHELIMETIISDSGNEGVKKYVDNNTGGVYYIGKFGSQKILYAKVTDMGADGVNGSFRTTGRAIAASKPRAIVMIGVAAAMDDKLKIGDVVVAREIVTFQDLKAIDDKNGKMEIIYRSKHYYPGSLYVLFDNIRGKQFEEYQKPTDCVSKIRKSIVLSGGVLLNSKEYKSALKNHFIEAEALEMEGYGLAAASISEGISNWILIKGICDKGEGKTDEFQETAMKKAIKLCKMIFDDPKNFPDSNRQSKLNSVFISGSHSKAVNDKQEEYIGKKLTDEFHKCEDAEQFAFELAKKLNSEGYRIVSGYGAEIGQAVVSGVFSNINFEGDEISKNLLCFPFPRMKNANYSQFQFEELKVKYREKMISETKTCICIFGAKLNEENVPIVADGVISEYKTSKRNNSFIVPVGATGFVSKMIWDDMSTDLDAFYPLPDATTKQIEERITAFNGLCVTTDFSKKEDRARLIDNIISFMKTYKKY